MPKTYELTFQRAPGKSVYVPTKASIDRGKMIISRVAKRYAPHPIFYHIGKRGGHVAALRRHLVSTYFSRFDLTNFFGNVVRAKVCSALRDIGFSNRVAFAWATDSCVVKDGRKFLPQGFPQSPLLATLVLEHSALGTKLVELSNQVLVTVYMDDLILSASTVEDVTAASEQVLAAAAGAHFPVSENKTALAQGTVEAFNCQLTHHAMRLTAQRLDQFASQWRGGTVASQQGIDRYVEAINADDLDRLAALVAATA
jgi:hypothetical protein